MRALILAGGFGTRLAGVIPDLPKPMAPIGSRPFLEYLVLQLRNERIDQITLCTGYQSDKIENYFSDGAGWGVSVDYCRETAPLGTGGATKIAIESHDDDQFLVMNGDSFFDAEIASLIEDHRTEQRLATIALVHVPDVARFGGVQLAGNRIQAFTEKGRRGPGLISGGIYVLHRDIARWIPEGASSIELDVFQRLIGNRFCGKILDGFFIDIGVPGDYHWLAQHPQAFSRLVTTAENRSVNDHSE